MCGKQKEIDFANDIAELPFEVRDSLLHSIFEISVSDSAHKNEEINILRKTIADYVKRRRAENNVRDET